MEKLNYHLNLMVGGPIRRYNLQMQIALLSDDYDTLSALYGGAINANYIELN